MSPTIIMAARGRDAAPMLMRRHTPADVLMSVVRYSMMHNRTAGMRRRDNIISHYFIYDVARSTEREQTLRRTD